MKKSKKLLVYRIVLMLLIIGAIVLIGIIGYKFYKNKIVEEENSKEEIVEDTNKKVQEILKNAKEKGKITYINSKGS